MDTRPQKAEITVYTPMVSPFRRELRMGNVSIGRASECTIPIKDRYLSRRHAEIAAVERGWVLKDLGSANGTYLNGERVESEVPLTAGDKIRLGDTEIVFEVGDSTDRFFAVADTAGYASIAIPIQEIDDDPAAADIARLHTLNTLARDLIEDRSMDELFGFIVERAREHLNASRAALALLNDDKRSFSQVEVSRQDEHDESELTISQTLLKTIVDEKKALAFLDVSADEKLGAAMSIVMQGIRSIVAAPLTIGDDVVGLLYVDYLVTQRVITAEDVKLVAQIARIAAIKLETTRLREQAIEKRIMDEELRTAANIQRTLLPPAPKNIAGYTFAGVNQPCRTVSGDYYDFALRPDGRVYFAIGDVSGKGVTAGLMMAGLQVAFRIYSKEDPDPGTFVTQLNVALREILPRSKFVTLFLGRLDAATGEIEYVNAGHTPPLWIRDDGAHEITQSDLLLGVVTRAEYVNRRMKLGPGESLILFTDGVSEALNADGAELGSPALANQLRRLYGSDAESAAGAVTHAVLTHAGSADALDDDVTIVVVARDAVSEAPDFEATIRSRSSRDHS